MTETIMPSLFQRKPGPGDEAARRGCRLWVPTGVTLNVTEGRQRDGVRPPHAEARSTFRPAAMMGRRARAACPAERQCNCRLETLGEPPAPGALFKARTDPYEHSSLADTAGLVRSQLNAIPQPWARLTRMSASSSPIQAPPRIQIGISRLKPSLNQTPLSTPIGTRRDRRLNR